MSIENNNETVATSADEVAKTDEDINSITTATNEEDVSEVANDEAIESMESQESKNDENYSASEDEPEEDKGNSSTSSTNKDDDSGGIFDEISPCVKVGIGLVGLAAIGCMAYKMFEDE